MNPLLNKQKSYLRKDLNMKFPLVHGNIKKQPTAIKDKIYVSTGIHYP